MKIIQITDLHINKDVDYEKNNCKPYYKLKETLDAISKNHDDDLHLVITGDLSGDVTNESYNHIKNLLKRYHYKVTLLPGNHDDSKLMKSICDDQITFDYSTINTKNNIFFNFNTQIEGQVGGSIKKNEIFSLNEKINDEIFNIIIFTHHPIVKVNSKWIDNHVAHNSDILMELMLANENIQFNIFSGHVHQEHCQIQRNVKVYTTPSTCYQFKPNSDEYLIDSDLTNGYRVIQLNNNTVQTNIVRL